MKKLILATIAMLIAGVASAELVVDGGFDNALNSTDPAVQYDNTGDWHVGGTVWSTAGVGSGNALTLEAAWSLKTAIQTIADGGSSTGAGNISFDWVAVAGNADNDWGFKVFGVNWDYTGSGEEFTTTPAIPATGVTLLKNVQFTNVGAGSGTINEALDFGTGYAHIVVSFNALWRGNMATEALAIDNVSIIPEPASMGMIAIGAMAALLLRRLHI